MSSTEILSSMVSGLIGAICGSLITAWLQNWINKKNENRKAMKDYLRIINKMIIANDADDFSEHETLVEQECELRMNIAYLLEKIDKSLLFQIKDTMCLFDTRKNNYVETYKDENLFDEEQYYTFENKKTRFAKDIHRFKEKLMKKVI